MLGATQEANTAHGRPTFGAARALPGLNMSGGHIALSQTLSNGRRGGARAAHAGGRT